MISSDFKIKQAVVTLDLSAVDENVLSYLSFLNKEIPMDALYFLHVIKKASFFRNLFFRDKDALKEQLQLDESMLEQFIKKVEAKFEANDGINLEYGVKEGNPLQTIINEAKEQHADLVVVGKKALTDSSGVLGRNIARRSPASVLVVPYVVKPQLKRIIVPVDFSENSGRALQRAFELNQVLDKPAKIVCTHIYEMPDLSVYKINKTHEQLKAIIEQDMHEAFDRFLDRYAPDLGDTVEKIVVERSNISTAGHLNDAMNDWDADLVILGAKGHSPVETLLLGSVTEKFILMNEKVPTLIVR
jgi:nucleotide-binding universal stress UspA family protein